MPSPTTPLEKGNESQLTSANVSGSTSKTPSRSRVSLGAPANFYFRYVNSSKKAASSSSACLGDSDTHNDENENLTGTISIPGMNKFTSMNENSLLSLGASSNGSSDQSDSDVLNKSTLSDTTDLTASSFVLQATSRQAMRRLSLQAQPQKSTRCNSLDNANTNEGQLAPNETADSSRKKSNVSGGETPVGASNRHSIKGVSPSLRQRMSATPQSLRKLTQDLRYQRMNRQAKQDSRLSVDSRNAIQALNAQLDSLNSNKNSHDIVNPDRNKQALDLSEDEVALERATANQSCTILDISGAMEEVFAAQQDDNSSYPSSPGKQGEQRIASKEGGKVVTKDNDAVLAAQQDDNSSHPSSSGKHDEQWIASKEGEEIVTKGHDAVLIAQQDDNSSHPLSAGEQDEEWIPSKEGKRIVNKDHYTVLPAQQDDNSSHPPSPGKQDEDWTPSKEGEKNVNKDHFTVLRAQPDDNSSDPPSPGKQDEQWIPSKEGGELVNKERDAVLGAQQDLNSSHSFSPCIQDVEWITSKEERNLVNKEDDAVPMMIHVSNKRSFEAKQMLVTDLEGSESNEGPTWSSMDTTSPAVPDRLTPGPTPTKLKSSPRRVPNPRTLDSPARNTRSSTKIEHSKTAEQGRASHRYQQQEGTASLADVQVAGVDHSGFEFSPRALANSHSGTPKHEINGQSGSPGGLHDPGKGNMRLDAALPGFLEGGTPDDSRPEGTDGKIRSSFRNKNDAASFRQNRTNYDGGSISIDDTPIVVERQTPTSTPEKYRSPDTDVTGEHPSAAAGPMASSVQTDGDTASLSDVADILGTGIPQAQYKAPKPLIFHQQNPDYCQTLTEISQSSRTSWEPNSAESASNGPETASIHDLAEMLDTKSKQMNESKPAPSVVGSTAQPYVPHETSQKEDPRFALSSADKRRPPCMKSINEESDFTERFGDDTGEKTGQAFSKHTDDSNDLSRSKNSPFRRSHTSSKATPTRIAPSPKRITNPRHSDSPAKNTRAATKAALKGVESSSSSSFNWSPAPQRSHSALSESPDILKEASPRITLGPFVDSSLQSGMKRKSELLEPSGIVQQKENIEMSPSCKNTMPAGILSSKKKARAQYLLKSSHRLVAFGSPEAAEYHVGSPSVNMTPMPSSKAKALFQIPTGENVEEGTQTCQGASGDQTVEIEADINVLVDRISVQNMQESPELSPISNVRDDTGPVTLAGNYKPFEGSEGPASTSSRARSNDFSSDHQQGDSTVEMECAMEGLLSNIHCGTAHSRNDYDNGDVERTEQNNPIAIVESRKRNDVSPAESVDKTDALSIASMNSARSEKEKFTSKLELDAQKLDFGFNKTGYVNALEEGRERSDIDDHATAELENDITSLLAAAGMRTNVGSGQNLLSDSEKVVDSHSDLDTKSVFPASGESMVASDDTTSSFISNDSTRKSIASKTLSLAADDEVQISNKGEVLVAAPQSLSATEESEFSLPQETATVRPNRSLIGQQISLTYDEVLDSSVASFKDLKPIVDPNTFDALVRFDSCCQDVGKPVSERWNQYLGAVCCEVERRTESVGTASETMSSVFGSEPQRFVHLQVRMRSNESRYIRAELRTVFTESRKVVGTEWVSWLVTVMRSFADPLMESYDGNNLTVSTIDELVREVGVVQEEIKRSNHRKARRNSLGRKRTASTELEREVSLLESTIAEHQATLDAVTSRVNECDRLVHMMGEKLRYLNELNYIGHEARASQKRYMSLRGLHSWMPLEVADGRLKLVCIGTYRPISTTMEYEVSEGKPLKTKVTQDSRMTGTSIAVARKQSNPTIATFFGSRVQHLVEASNNASAKPPACLAQGIQNYIWCAGRVDVISFELQRILSRYSCSLRRTDTKLLLDVKFVGPSSTLSAVFAIESCYPSLPLDVTMEIWEGNIDFDGIRRALLKSAVPGIGYLSRACDVLSAYVK